MKNKKETRTCIVCRNKDNKNNLIRIAVSEEGVIIDIEQKIQGRGYYICKNEECLKKMTKNKVLTKTLKLEEEKYNKIRGVILGG